MRCGEAVSTPSPDLDEESSILRKQSPSLLRQPKDGNVGIVSEKYPANTLGVQINVPRVVSVNLSPQGLPKFLNVWTLPEHVEKGLHLAAIFSLGAVVS